MATYVRFEVLKETEKGKRESNATPTHHYSLRSRSSPSAGLAADSGAGQKKEVKGERRRDKLRRVLRRRSRVKKGVCGDVKVESTRKRVKLRSSAIHQKEVIVPSQDPASSPTHIVIKTNPLFASSSPQDGGQGSEGGVAGEEAFLGQRRKIRKTKEHEMISAVMEVTKHSKKNTSLLQKLQSLGTKKGSSHISMEREGEERRGKRRRRRGRGKAMRSPLTIRNSNTELYHMLTQI